MDVADETEPHLNMLGDDDRGVQGLRNSELLEID